MQAEGIGGGNRIKCAKRPYSRDNVNSAEIFSIFIDGTIKMEIIDKVVSKIREIRQEILGKAFVVTWLMCKHDRFG